MRRITLAWLAWLALPWCMATGAGFPAGWPNLAKPPTAADSAAIVQNGWATSRDTLAAALVKSYRPGTSVAPGSTGNSAYAGWLTLWRWCNLLARDEKTSAQQFVARNLVNAPTAQNGATFYSSGNRPDGAPPPPREVAEKILNGPVFLGFLRGLVPPKTPMPETRPLGDLLPTAAQTAWTADPKFLQALLNTLSPDDYAPQVLRNLADIYQAQPEQFHDYAALAVALAVVYDVRPPSYWPHRQVTPSLVPRSEQPVASRFAFWVKSNEAKVLLTDLRELPPEQLKFVVDAPLAESELIWAQNNEPYLRPEFYRIFSDIVYNHPRLANDEFNWDKEPYTLANIRHDGGICVDQAYFGAVCGKAVGLPTLFFDGQTTQDGGHAWFGYLKGPDEWQLDCGRYASMGIVTGKALDPQTWGNLTDHELDYLTRSFRRRPGYLASMGDLSMAAIFHAAGDKTNEARTLDSAIAVCPLNDAAWDAKTEFLQKNAVAPHELRAHYEAAIRQFSRVPDLKVFYQMSLAEWARQQGDEATANNLLGQIASVNQASRTDLALMAESDKISALLKAGDSHKAVQEFQSTAPALGGKAGGDLFYKVGAPFAYRLYSQGDLSNARQVMATTRTVLKPTAKSSLDNDMAKVEDLLNHPVRDSLSHLSK